MDVNEKIYKFGSFTFTVKEYNLKKGKKELYLRPKTYETLLFLIEHHGSLVKKEDLIENVWSDIIVTENTLTQCIKEIREKLEDDPANPKYIKTIPRKGYKFIAPVKEEVSNQNFPPEKTKQLYFEIIKNNKIIISILTALLISISIFLLKNGKPEYNFSERDWVLILDFDNQTGLEIFNSALRTALEIELSNSKYVNVVPQGRVLDILRLMKQNPDVKIDRYLGREICLRDGNIQIMISGSIFAISNNYSISLVIIDPVKNTIVKSFSQNVNNQQEVLQAINKLSISIRRELGESLDNLPKIETNLEKVTTSSLKALNFYSKGVFYINLFDFDKAELFLKQAVLHDTTFAMGYVMLGFNNLWNSNLSKGKINFNKAAELANNLVDREKFFILGSNALFGLGDYKKGIEFYELLLSLYPDDYWGNENLSIAYLGDGKIKQYFKYKKICESLRPNYFINHSDKGLFSLYYDGDIYEANKEFLRALELKPDFNFEFPYLTGAFLDWMHEEVDSAEKKFTKFLLHDVNNLIPMAQITSRWFIARFYIFDGKLDEAINILQESISIAKKYPESNLLYWSQMELALIYLNLNKNKQFKSLIKNVIDNSVGILRIQAIGWLAINYAKNGKSHKAKILLDKLKNENRIMPVGIIQMPLPKDMKKAKQVFSLQIEGDIALANKNYNKAIQLFKKVIELVPPSHIPPITALNPRIRWVSLKSLAQVYKTKKDLDSEISAYKNILEDKILTITVPAVSSIWVKSLLSISESFEKQGNYKDSKIYTERYKRLWNRKNDL